MPRRKQPSGLTRLKKKSPFDKGRKSAEETKANRRKALDASSFNPSLQLTKDKSRGDLADIEFRMKLTFGI